MSFSWKKYYFMLLQTPHVTTDGNRSYTLKALSDILKWRRFRARARLLFRDRYCPVKRLEKNESKSGGFCDISLLPTSPLPHHDTKLTAKWNGILGYCMTAIFILGNIFCPVLKEHLSFERRKWWNMQKPQEGLLSLHATLQNLERKETSSELQGATFPSYT